MLSRHLLAACIVLGLLAPAEAQFGGGGRRGGRDQKPKMEPFAADGTIEAMGPQGFEILTTTNQRWRVFVDRETVVRLTGTAAPEFLRPGLYVKFTAEFDKRDKAKEKVKKLTLFTPTQPIDIGFWPEGMAPQTKPPGEKPKGRGGFGAAAGGGFGFEGAGADAQASEILTVHGQIRGSRKGLLTVDAGRAMFQFELAEEPEIAVDIVGRLANMGNLMAAKKGDKISITKGKMPPGAMAMEQQMGMAQAQELTIQLSEPLGTPKKKPVRRTTKTPVRRSTKGQPKEEPKEGPEKEPFDTPR